LKTKYKDINSKLIAQCKKGNSKSQIEIYKIYSQAMYNTSLRIVKNETEAEDLIQDAFLKAFQNIKQFSEEVSFGTWLKKIVVNSSLDFLKKRKIEFVYIDEHKLIKKHENENNKNNDSIDLEVAKIKNAIMKLPDGYRVVLTLYLLEGYDHSEISEILGISASSSR